jgi:glycine cleavage system H protein
VKAASDIYCPISGEILEVNSSIEKSPGLVNESPFEDGWFIKIKISSEGQADLKTLLDEKAYTKLKEDEKH